MVINLPVDVEDAVRERASVAGFRDADEYVLSLVQQDQVVRRWEESVAEKSQIEAVALEGLASGPAVPLDMNALRQSFRERRQTSDGEP